VNIVVRPATKDLFGDVATMLGPKNPTSSVCWCLSHRLDFPRVVMRLDLR
jgi:hypothetical protein